MAGLATMATAEKALKDFFLGPLRVQIDEGSGALLAKMEKSTKEVTGGKIKLPLKYGRSGGIGNRADDGTLPTPNPRKHAIAEFQTKNVFGNIQLTDKLIRTSQSDKGAFVNLLQAHMEDLTNDARNDLRRQIFMDGVGKLTLINDTANSTTHAVINTQYLSEGQIVDVLNTSNAVTQTAREILSVDHDAKTVTFSGAAFTTAATDYITITGNYNLELTGLAKILTANNTLYGIDRSTEKWFNPNVNTQNTTPTEIDELIIQKMIDTIETRSGDMVDFILCGYGVARAFQYNQLQYKKNIEYTTLVGGYEEMKFGKSALVRDKFAPEKTMDFLSTQSLKLCRLSDWDWMDKDGAILSRVSGKAAYEATLVMYGDIACDKPISNGRLTYIIEH